MDSPTKKISFGKISTPFDEDLEDRIVELSFDDNTLNMETDTTNVDLKTVVDDMDSESDGEVNIFIGKHDINEEPYIDTLIEEDSLLNDEIKTLFNDSCSVSVSLTQSGLACVGLEGLY
ncbi:unnamed protein product [Macrosiphum euphorbiae]|uniref:Uncharacterized protein n=1 Tax=Macrosiphum euphorbiae TaxID=13131 RepID=A0AAV0Y4P1_9HEMI|nr:unnamed protein product [Macrosiphum euphorbiae]